MGRVFSVDGPVVIAEDLENCYVGSEVEISDNSIVGEIVELRGDKVVIQVYEDTVGIKPGDVVVDRKRPLSVELGPGLLGSIFDGIQRPLDKLYIQYGGYVPLGVRIPALPRDKKWHFVPLVKIGDILSEGQIFGEVKETEFIVHRLLVPIGVSGKVVDVLAEGDYGVEDVVVVVEVDDGKKVELTMVQVWPVRRKRPVKNRLRANLPLMTGQRVIDFLFPVAKGGVAAIPGGFGTGKTVTQHQLAKWSDVDVVVYIGCGERGNEIAQVLEEFPNLQDPRTGRPLIERTVIIANTSNMPVAAREASIYTGITIAEYFRDQGYNVALMADSTSRWAEALREIAGRLEMMPAEEGYPAYLASRLAEFYERAGYVETLCGKRGSVTIIGAVSPPGGDFSEPVTMHTKRFVRTFWALDKRLAGQRHFPSINWLDSYSGYVLDLEKWWSDRFPQLDWTQMRAKVMEILQTADNLERVAQLVGVDTLPDEQRLVIEVGRVFKYGFLQQNAHSDVDSYCCLEKGLYLMKIILDFYEKAKSLLNRGLHIVAILESDFVSQILRLKEEVSNEDVPLLREFLDKMMEKMAEMEMRYVGR